MKRFALSITIIVCTLQLLSAEGTISRGMGRAGMTEPNNTLSAVTNPSLLAYSSTSDFAFNYNTNDKIAMSRYDIIWTGMLQTEKLGTGLSFEYQYEPSEPLYIIRTYRLGIPMCYRLKPYLSLGVTPHLIYFQQYSASPARSLNAHVSVMGDYKKLIFAAVSLENILKDPHTERMLSIGIKNNFLFDVPIYYQYVHTLTTKENEHRFGIEYRLYPHADLRAGFRYDAERENNNFFTLGATWFASQDLAISYSYENNGSNHIELHSVSLKLIDFTITED